MPLRLQAVAWSLVWPDFFLANQASAVAADVAIALAVGLLMPSGCATQQTTGVPKAPAVMMTCARPIKIGLVTAVDVRLSASSPRLILLKAPQAVSPSGEHTAPLNFESAIQQAGGADKLAATLEQIPSGTEVMADDLLGAAAGTGAIPMGLGLLILPIVLPATAVSDATELPRRRLEGRYFGDPSYRPTGSEESYFLASPPQFGQSGYLFYPMGSYTALSITFGDYDLSTETVDNPATATCTIQWPQRAPVHRDEKYFHETVRRILASSEESLDALCGPAGSH
jgi:hypothetical protein